MAHRRQAWHEFWQWLLGNEPASDGGVRLNTSGPSVIMVIRHGEKPTGSQLGYADQACTTQDSHGLTRQGWARALGIADLFAPAGHGIRPDLYTPTVIAAADGPNAGNRMKQTVSLLAKRLGLTVVLRFDKGGDYKNLVKWAKTLKVGDRLLISWEHSEIPKLAKLLSSKVPSSWPDDRFDVVWIFTADGKGGWIFREAPEMVLIGDRDTGVKGNVIPVPPTPEPPVPVPPPIPEPTPDPTPPPVTPPPVTPPPVTPPVQPPVVPPPPSTIKPVSVLDFSRWKLDYGTPDGLVTLSSVQLKASAGVTPYFHAQYGPDDLPELVLETTAGYATTPTSHYSRAELREMLRNSSKLASWSADKGRHEMSLAGRVIQIPDGEGGIVVGQIHNAKGDQLEILVRPDGTVTCRVNGSSSGQKVAPAPIGKRYAYSVVANAGTTVVVWNGAVILSTTKIKGPGSYFKAGNYLNMTAGHSAVAITGLNILHTPEIA